MISTEYLARRLQRLSRLEATLTVLVAAAGATLANAAFSRLGLASRLSQLSTQLGHFLSHEEASLGSLGALGVLGLGLIYGLKHATEVDHVVAVSTIVSEHRKLSQAALVGGLWGAGHTLSLAIVGSVVLAMRIAIPDRLASLLEFGVALMIIGLGLSATAKALCRRGGFHWHRHTHDDFAHVHVHFHEPGTQHVGPIESHSHALTRIGLKPVLVGAMHGLAGSAALTLLVLTQIRSVALGLLYLGVFGLGSIGGMLIMSGVVGLPFVWSANRLSRAHFGLQMAAGALSVCFGIWYAYSICVENGLVVAFRS